MLNKRKIMKLLNLMLVLILVTLSIASAIPKPDEEDHKNRVLDKELSDKQHYDDDDDDLDHNSEYDHEAFLGREDAKTFDQLSPEESKDRLGKIYDKIDKDGNGQVTEEELKDWIKHVQNKYINDDTDRQWKEHDADEDNTLVWESYKKRTYGDIDDQDDDDDEESSYNYKDMVHRDERRWKLADKDGDNKLTKQEFTDFLHPEDAEHMRDIVIDETLEDIDKNKDGFISIEEYIGDMYPDPEIEDEPEWVSSEREQFLTHRDKNQDGKMDRDEIKDWIMPEDWDHVKVETQHLIHEADADKDMWPNSDHDEEPDWVKTEREQFANFRDKNNDGRMDRQEVKDWIIPPDYDHSEAEAKHLIYESDNDQDGELSRDEVLDKYDLFVGSQATDFGEALTRHDEF